MEIREVTDIGEIMKIVPIEVELLRGETIGMSLRDKLTWIDGELNGKQLYTKYEFKVFMIYEGEKLVGYAIAALTKSKIKYLSEIRIYRVWHEKKNKEIAELFMKRIEEWARENKIDKIRSEADKPSMKRLLKSKYGFKVISTNMEKEVSRWEAQ
jgi:N-acetylglutamate synthase-like GNAT family acetyltransferase